MQQAKKTSLGYLLEALPTVLARRGGSDAKIHGIAADSRCVEPGDLFIAIPGLHVDGHRFIPQAVKAGAAVVIGERPPAGLSEAPGDITYVQVPDARKAWGRLCAAWYEFPSRKMTLIGVTGTDGKTTTVNIVYSILRTAGFNAGMLSTVNFRIGEEESSTGLHTTTPDPPDVQRYLAQMVEAGATHAVLEVTSHGLAQHRVAGCDFDVAVVTNITHEHLDFHGSLEAYRQAKARLFEGLSTSSRKNGVPKVAVLNGDDDSFPYLKPIPADRQVVYSIGKDADVTAHDVDFGDRTRFVLHTPAGKTNVKTSLIGAYNVSNILAAASVGIALDIPLEAIAEGISSVQGVPGRMQRIEEEGQDFLAVVDFAHTPNALRQALITAREMTDETGRVIVVFGSAGLRDREKRKMMGRVAGELADVAIVTAEDPRTESLADIMSECADAAEVEGKVEGRDLFLVPDRGEAILRACQMACSGDVVIACGKGHEQSMCFDTTEYPWDDRKAMRLALRGETLDTLPTATKEERRIG